LEEEIKINNLNYKKIFALVLFFSAASCSLYSQVTFSTAFPGRTFTQPVFLTHAYDGTNRIFVVQQNGYIMVFPNDSASTTMNTFLNVTNKIITGSERGLLNVAFHPNYESNRFFYIYYTRAGDGALVVSRFTTQAGDPNKADSLSEFNLLTVPHPTYSNHNGGCMMFGLDGYLYMGMGDGGSGGDPFNNAQDTTKFLGKILRINVDGASGGNNYAIPPGNPFPNGTRPEIYTYGMRNPWRFSQDPVTGIIYHGDVGQDCWEEVDIITAGSNYGWKIMEGFYCYAGVSPCNSTSCNQTGLTLPIKTYQNSGSDCSITGGYVYRGARVPWLVGRYVYADYCSRRTYKLLYSAGVVSDTLQIGLAPSSVYSFGVDQNNELYTLCSDGVIYKFTNTVIGINNNGEVPSGFALEQNYPNPFNPSTKIDFTIPKASFTTLSIFDVTGKLVETLLSGDINEGWHSVNWNASDFPSGVYFYRLSSGSFSVEKKMVLVK
jgi:glucose/arabinose dehydrogenase